MGHPDPDPDFENRIRIRKKIPEPQHWLEAKELSSVLQIRKFAKKIRETEGKNSRFCRKILWTILSRELQFIALTSSILIINISYIWWSAGFVILIVFVFVDILPCVSENTERNSALDPATCEPMQCGTVPDTTTPRTAGRTAGAKDRRICWSAVNVFYFPRTQGFASVPRYTHGGIVFFSNHIKLDSK